MIHVACASDANYLPHAAAMMHSLLAQPHPAAITLHLLHAPGLDAALLGQLREFVTAQGAILRCHTIPDERVAGLPQMGRISRVMWFRVFLPELLAESPRVLYLDCDTIVMDNLESLWQMPLDGALLGAIGNVFEAGQETRPARLGLAGPAAYFNSGVLLLNLDAWRREGITQRLLALARDPAARLVWPDQDALNLVCAGRWQPLHPRWNCQNSLYFFRQAGAVFGAAIVREATAQPGILHFEGGELAKPWHFLCKHPLRGEYLRHRARTPWPLAAPEGRTPMNRLLRLLPMALLLPALRIFGRAQRVLRRRFGLAPKPP